MSPAPDSTLDDPREIIADLQRANAELQRRLDERTDERDEALQREIATAELLRVINASPGDLAPAFEAMLEKATRLCETSLGILWTYDGECFHSAAVRGLPERLAELFSGTVQPHPETGLGRMLRGERLVINPDMAAEAAYQAIRPGAPWSTFVVREMPSRLPCTRTTPFSAPS